MDDAEGAMDGGARVEQGLVDQLARATIGPTFNFYRDGPRAVLLRTRLCAYLESRREARLLLVGEAPGWRGTRVSGLPFTSERQLSGSGPAEATATIVQRVLAELGLGERVLLWNVVPTHPHAPGRPETNRRPTGGRSAPASRSSSRSRADEPWWPSAGSRSVRFPPCSRSGTRPTVGRRRSGPG